MTRDRCRLVNVDGTTVSIRGSADPTPEDLAAVAELVRALREADARLTPEQRQERDKKQARGRARIRAIRERAGLT